MSPTPSLQGYSSTRTASEPLLSVSESRWEQFDKNYLSKLLLRKSVYRKSELWEAYQKINIRDAISVIDQVGAGAHCAPSDSNQNPHVDRWYRHSDRLSHTHTLVQIQPECALRLNDDGLNRTAGTDG